MSDLAAIAYPVSPKAETNILEMVQEMIVSRTALGSLRSKLELSDRLVAREPEPLTGNRRLEVTIPIISPQVDTMAAYLASIFLNNESVFPMEGEEDNKFLTEAVNGKFKQFAADWQWKRNLLLGFKDASKYNLMAIEATWKEVKIPTLSTDSITTGTGNKQLLGSLKQKAGFAITHLDPYNTFWDMAVDPSQLSSEGEFAGYFTTMNKVRLHKFLLSLPANNGYQSRLPEILSCSTGVRHSYVPKIVQYNATTGVTNWDTIFSSVLGRNVGCNTNHEVTTIYCRIVPKTLGMYRIPQPGTPQIWKFVIVDAQFVVYAECRTNAHDYLPIIIGVPNETNLGYQQKTLPEELSDVQDLASKFMVMELESNRRVVANREIYNPQMIKSEDINNPSPVAKIPLRTQALDQDPSKAVHSIAYNDPALGTRSALASQLSQYASLVTGQNQVTNGGFVKGNKTNDQFNETISRSDARQTTMAILLEDQAFSVLKHLLLFDFVQYQGTLNAYDEASQTSIPADLTLLLNEDMNFEVNDDLSLTLDQVDPTTIVTAMQTIQTTPQLQQEYDVSKLFAYLLKLQGIDSVEDFIRKNPQLAGVVPQQGQQQPQQGLPASNQTPQGGQPPALPQQPNDPSNFSQVMSNALSANGDTNGNTVPPTGQ